uniref:Uncharacterized protein n=1 Tax=Arundo donax TaxID=35708 RepID=A0A0A8Y4P7_ARUDO
MIQKKNTKDIIRLVLCQPKWSTHEPYTTILDPSNCFSIYLQILIESSWNT